MRRFIAIFVFLSVQIAQAQPEMSPGAETRYQPLEKTIFYQLGETSLPIVVLQYGDKNNIVCVNLHDNEGTSVQAAKSVLEEKGGTLIRIQNAEERQIRFRLRGRTFLVDPNRIFSREGIEACLRDNRCYAPFAVEEIAKLGKRILGLLPPNVDYLVALHNNTEGNYSVKSYLPKGDKRKDARAVHEAKDQDSDDIVFTTDEKIYRSMAEAGYNSIWQDNHKAKKDGSLSVYCGEKQISYVNIETEHGRVGQYEEMFRKLLSILE